VSAQAELQAALVAALAGVANGVFDGPPADAVLPYLSIEGGLTTDWSTKSARGREHRIGITVREENARAARLRGLLDAVAEAIEALPAELPGHRIASIAFLKEDIVRSDTEPWAGTIRYRVRTLET